MATGQTIRWLTSLEGVITFVPSAFTTTGTVSIRTIASPCCSKPSTRAVPRETSRMRGLMYGPRSSITTSALLPFAKLVTSKRVPNGYVRLAALMPLAWNGMPSAIGRPSSREPYQEAKPVSARADAMLASAANKKMRGRMIFRG